MYLSEPEMGAKTEFIFSQKQYAPIWHAAFGLLVTISLGIAYASAVSSSWGYVLGILTSSIVILWWIKKAVLIEVTNNVLRVGTYVIDRKFIGQIESLSANEFLTRIRSGAHRQDVFVLRGISNGGVVLEIKDPDDPFCHWVVSCKSASKLASALTEHQ